MEMLVFHRHASNQAQEYQSACTKELFQSYEKTSQLYFVRSENKRITPTSMQSNASYCSGMIRDARIAIRPSLSRISQCRMVELKGIVSLIGKEEQKVTDEELRKFLLSLNRGRLD